MQLNCPSPPATPSVLRPGSSSSRPHSARLGAKRDYERGWARAAIVTPKLPTKGRTESVAKCDANRGAAIGGGPLDDDQHEAGPNEPFLKMFDAASSSDSPAAETESLTNGSIHLPTKRVAAPSSGGKASAKAFVKSVGSSIGVASAAAVESDFEMVAFQQILLTLRDEASSFNSFAVACDAALSRAEAFGASHRTMLAEDDEPELATDETDVGDDDSVSLEGARTPLAKKKAKKEGMSLPTQLETSIAASLLIKLTPHLGGFGVLIHRLVLRLISGTFRSIPAGIQTSTPSKQPSEADFLALTRTLAFSADCGRLEARLKEKDEALKSTKATLFANSAIFFRLAGKHSSDRLQRVFVAWRQLVRSKRSFENHFASLRKIQLCRELKRETFLRWSSYVHAAKESRATSLSAANHDKMHSRLSDLNARCSQREDQLGSQRTAKEKYAARCDRLEELYAFEKEELAKCRTKLLSCEQEITRFRSLATHVIYAFDRLTGVIPVLHFSPSMIQEMVEASFKRDLNIRRGVAAAVHPSGSAPNRGGGDDAAALEASLTGNMSPGRVAHHHGGASTASHISLHPKLLISEEYNLPFLVHGGGTANFEEYVDDVYLTVLKWLNFAKDETRQFVESLRVQKCGTSKDPFAFSMEDNDSLRAQRDTEMVGRPVHDFSKDLYDGRIYQLILWRMVSHRYGGTPYISSSSPNGDSIRHAHFAATSQSSGVAPYVTFETNLDRMRLVVKLAKFVGIDAGVTAETLLEPGVRARYHHFLFCCRLMSAHATCTPHHWSLQGTRTQAGGTATGNTPGATWRGGGGGSPLMHRNDPSLASAIANQSSTASGLTTAHLLQILQSASQRLDTLERWRAVIRNVENYAAQIATGSAQLDVGSHRSPTVMREFLIDKGIISEQTPPQSLRFAKPLTNRQGQTVEGNAGQQRGGNSMFLSSVRSAAGGLAAAELSGAHTPFFMRSMMDRTLESSESGCAHDDSPDMSSGRGMSPVTLSPSPMNNAVAFLWSEVNHIFAQNANELQLVQWYYASKAGLDVVELVWDTPAWFLFISDSKMNANKHVSKTISDAVFRSVAAFNPQSIKTAINSLQPAILQQRFSVVGSSSRGGGPGTPSKHQRAGATAATSDSNDASASGATGDDDGQGGSIPYQMPISRFPTAIVRLFLARSLNPPSQALTWQDVDRAVECFRDFVTAVILAPAVGRSQAHHFLKLYLQPAVQEVFKAQKDPLRRIFSEIGTRDPLTQLTRIRKDAFVHFVTRDLKTLSSASDQDSVVELYHVCRIVSSIHNPITASNKPQVSSTATTTTNGNNQGTVQQVSAYVAGLDVAGFQVAIMLLSRVKNGLLLQPQDVALGQYLNTIVFPVCQFKFKLKL